MASQVEISIEKCATIVALRQAVLPIHQIVKQCSVSIRGVQFTLHCQKTTGSNKDIPRPGKPCKTTKSDYKYIRISSKRNRFKTAPQICAELIAMNMTTISVATVKRRLTEACLKGCVAARKPLLRPTDKQKRLEWVRKHLVYQSTSAHFDLNKLVKTL
ncbi:uncharacterized protein LOC124594226 [Schistocerca americana]|uniref:uncharacterized protein LOC124594226 n=1 Tax=Schistocerca americana TaxID=7009 RepID=UPI001F4F384F|nr:uncharacterized protein LOC124594226 [Schistocerca americana]